MGCGKVSPPLQVSARRALIELFHDLYLISTSQYQPISWNDWLGEGQFMQVRYLEKDSIIGPRFKARPQTIHAGEMWDRD
jgi:hypothetical protein